MNDDLETDGDARLSIPPAGTFEEASAAAARRFRTSDRVAALIDVAYAPVDSPLGPLVAAVTRRGLVMLSYGTDDFEVEALALARIVSARILEAPARVDPVRRQLDEYFERRRQRFEVPIDWSLVRGFGRDVLSATARNRSGSGPAATPAESRRKSGRESSGFVTSIGSPPHSRMRSRSSAATASKRAAASPPTAAS